MIKTTRLAALASCSMISICLAAPLAVGQEQAPEETEARQQTVIISATRREESIQDVPVSATAFGADDIQALRLQATSDIADQAPNINLVQGNFGFGAPIISVRGITNGDFSATSNTPVTVYSDDIPLTQIVTHGFGLYDLERIELLRGPQGTLFGRNATSGALQFVSAGPTETFEAGGNLTIARYDDVAIQGYISGPIAGDKVKGRLAFNSRQRDGVVRNLLTNEFESEIDNWSVRGTLDFEPTDRFDLRIKAQSSDSSGTGVIFHNSLGDNDVQTPALFGGPVEIGGDDADFKAITLDLPNRPENVRFDELMVRGNLALDEKWTLTGILGYSDLDFESFNDDDASAVRAVHEYSNRQVEQLSAEFRLAGQLGPIDLVSGVFFMNEETDSVGAFEITDDVLIGTAAQIALEAGFGLTPQLAPTDRLVTTNELKQDLDAFAVFAHGKFDLSDKWAISAGLRYSEDKKDITVVDGNVSSFASPDPFFYGQRVSNNPAFSNFIDIGGLFGVAGTVSDSISADALSGEFKLEYRPNDDVLIYGSYQRGFKGSSFDATQTDTATGTISSVPSESVDAFELGVKTSSFNDRLFINGAAFHYNYEDFQAFEFLSVGGFLTSLLISLPEVEVQGLEVEIQAHPIDNLTLVAGLGLVETEITDPNAQLPPGVNLTIAAGNEVRNAPDMNFNFTGAYDFSLMNGAYFLTPQVEYVHVGEYFSDFINTAPGTQYPNLVTGGTITAANGSLAGDYDQLNLQLSLTRSDERYALTVFGQNVTAETQVTGRFPGNYVFGGTDFATVNDGTAAVWGVRLDAKF